MKEIKFVRFSHKAAAPIRGTNDSTGYDLFSVEKCTIKPRSAYAVSTDIGTQNR